MRAPPEIARRGTGFDAENGTSFSETVLAAIVRRFSQDAVERRSSGECSSLYRCARGRSRLLYLGER